RTVYSSAFDETEQTPDQAQLPIVRFRPAACDSRRIHRERGRSRARVRIGNIVLGRAGRAERGMSPRAAFLSASARIRFWRCTESEVDFDNHQEFAKGSGVRQFQARTIFPDRRGLLEVAAA